MNFVPSIQHAVRSWEAVHIHHIQAGATYKVPLDGTVNSIITAAVNWNASQVCKQEQPPDAQWYVNYENLFRQLNGLSAHEDVTPYSTVKLPKFTC